MCLSHPSQDRHIDLSSEDVDAVGCFLEYLYTGDYFPRKIPGQRQLEQDPSLPKVDDSGDQLLKHARVYTLAEKFQMPALRHLASSKIHCVNSTAKGEIAYARYVYQYIPRDDSHIRAPIVTFWAQRSHTLRAEAEDEFRSLCLEFPQFGYDVLSMLICPALFLHSGLLLAAALSCSLFGANKIFFSAQPAFSTRSSSASRSPRCTRQQPAGASDLVTATSRTSCLWGSRSLGESSAVRMYFEVYFSLSSIAIHISLLSYLPPSSLRNRKDKTEASFGALRWQRGGNSEHKPTGSTMPGFCCRMVSL